MAWHHIEDANLLFYGENIIVLGKHFSKKKCIVTFTSRMSKADLPGAPFASSLCESEKCSYVCFVAMKNHWWHVDDFDHALNRVKSYIEKIGYDEIIAYGGSMGGVGALHASNILPIDTAVIFSAQYDISPSIVPWDARWHDDAREESISLKNRSDKSSTSTKIIYLYDSFQLDKKHLEIYRKFLNVTPLNLPFSGHEVFKTLKESGIAGAVARDLLFSKGSFSSKSKKVKEKYRSARYKSWTFWKNVSEVSLRYRKDGLSEHAVMKLQGFDDGDIGVLHSIALFYLTQKKDFERAESIYDRCIAINPDHPAAWRGKAKCRQAKGDMLAAVEFALAAYARNPASADLCRVLIEAAFRASDWFLLSCAAQRYIAAVPDADGEEFFRRHAPPEKQLVLAPDVTAAFEANMQTIRRRVPKRYSQLLQCLAALKPATIVEVGVFNGENAKQMILAASAGANGIRAPFYYGFDLFEGMTDEVNAKEFSKLPLSEAEIGEKISASGSQYCLMSGFTENTLPKLPEHMKRLARDLDFAFIDGGRSEETIEADWENIAPLMHANSVVIFDDYYVDKSSELEGFGCNDLIDRLKADAKYNVEYLPVVDTFDKETFSLSVAMVKVRLSGAG